tara:strand:+ start:2752 stop:3327 length:576 start_codon:yes stop_codon:yes gene_type:complete
MKTIYEMTPEIVDWLSHTLVPIEAAVFRYHRGILKLTRQVDRVEQGMQPKYAALSAIREYNEKNCTGITYDEVKNRSADYVFLPPGEWVAYVEDLEDSNKIVTGDYDDPLKALDYADADIKWILLWLPDRDIVVVYRSPYEARCGLYEESIADGTCRGPFPAPTLPPEIVASIGHVDPREILEQHTQNWRR